MLFSRACEYGIRAILYVATRPDTDPILVRDIARDLQIPSPFLAKIVQTLTRGGVLNSQKGPGGGVNLARSAEEITLLQVVETIDGLNLTQACVMGIPECGDEAPCPLHGHWGDIRDRIVHMLENQSVFQVTDQLKEQGWVLTRH